MQRITRLSALLLSTTALLVGAATIAQAAPAPAAPAAPAAPTITTLPLFGVPLTVQVTTGPGGAIASVSVNPADGLTATTVKPNKVAFVNEAGTGKVVVSGHDGRQGVQVRAGAIADVSGDGGWSGDVFGDGTITSVTFTIGATADGGPDITNVASDDPTAVIGETQYESSDGDDSHHGHDGHDDGVLQRASVRITFTNGGQTRSLGIRAEVGTHDGQPRAKVSVALGKMRGVVQPAVDAAGPATWTGLLCDGTQATVHYTITEEGAITEVTADPNTATINAEGNNVEVRFSHDERVRIHVSTEDSGIKVSVKPRIRCEDAPDPTVNTPIDTTIPTDSTTPGDDDGDHHDHDHHGGGNGGNGNG
ncbi:MAG: hypothetical protein WCC60_00625, partial [Ilumatobacteraceae bacterium]